MTLALPHVYDWDKIIRLAIFDKDGEYHLKLESIGRVEYVVRLLGSEAE